MNLFREFILIVAGGLIGSVLGAGFGLFVGILSPELIGMLAHPHPVHAADRLGAALGLICGLMIGAGSMIIGRLISAVRPFASRSQEITSAVTSQVID